MRLTQIVVGLLMAPLSALAASPGTATPPAAGALVDATTAESWSSVTPSAPATWKLTGPGRFQVGFRANLPADGSAIPAGILMLRHQGKPLVQFRILPRPSNDTWKGDVQFRPSTTIGFYIDVAAGEQAYEFRLNGGGPAGGAVFVIDATKSKRPLAANAPVVPVPGTAVVASATPAPSPGASPAPTPAATPATAPAPSPRDARTPGGALAIWLGASQAAQTRSFVTGAAPSSELALGARWRAMPLAQLWASAAMESTEELIPLPLAPVTRIAEKRLLVDAGGGIRLAAGGASLVAGPALRYASFDSNAASYDWAMASLAGRLEIPVGPVTAYGTGEAGIPIADGTPAGWEDGDLLRRLAWGGGLRYTHRSLPASPSIGVGYRGEIVSRRYSDLISHGARLVLQVDL